MAQLRIPQGAHVAFRIQQLNAFDVSFSIHVYSAGRDGWSVASFRNKCNSLDSGVQPLPKGEWLVQQDLIGRCGFWIMPEDGDHLEDPNSEVCDGEWLTIEASEATRHHRVHRFVDRKPGLEAVLAFGYRMSGFFVKNPRSGFWTLPPDPAPPKDAT